MTSASQAAEILGGFTVTLENAGLTEEIAASLTDAYVGEVRAVQATTGVPSFTVNDTTLTEQVIQFEAESIAADIAGNLNGVRSTVIRSLLAGQKPDLEQLVTDSIDLTEKQVRTEAQTALMGYNRALTQAKAKEAFGDNPLYYYVGPDDKVTRPFCHARVNKVWSQKEIDSWDNGTDLPAPVYCGGYNCRHHLRPMSKELAAKFERGDESALED